MEGTKPRPKEQDREGHGRGATLERAVAFGKREARAWTLERPKDCNR